MLKRKISRKGYRVYFFVGITVLNRVATEEITEWEGGMSHWRYLGQSISCGGGNESAKAWIWKWRDIFSEHKGFPGGSDGKECACNAGDPGLIPGSGRSPGVGNGNLLQYYCLENSMDRGPLVGYSSLGCKELDMTEDTHTYTHTHYTV